MVLIDLVVVCVLFGRLGGHSLWEQVGGKVLKPEGVVR